ncbi:class I SAM-dependent methyltransferase [Propionivibrio sp.]|uniref:methyltransferase domain-containing protein n=1 Tax=Propionivibrio sp. TaxID=2212460 RepID=UPI0025E454AD|nr:class I SAM-dependent methyltransferase [Propionivibrio sp.]MBK8743877.1 methyltransferase domain-containing protein [Propionivibrio sp.]
MKNINEQGSVSPAVGEVSDIYRDGTYLRNNPTLHGEDSAYKFAYIRRLLTRCAFPEKSVRVLDVGGGGGIIAALVCEQLAQQGLQVECHAFDLSPEMLAQQRANNRFNTLATSDFGEIRRQRYDLALLIDVVEHIPDNGLVADDIDRIARQVIYNIPIERNLLDWLRNLYMKRRYYVLQTASLGHVHFYSYGSAKRFVREHHQPVASIFPDYPGHLLESDFPDYVVQRANRLRGLELLLSRFIYRRLKPLAPWLIQGSLFILADSRSRPR